MQASKETCNSLKPTMQFKFRVWSHQSMVEYKRHSLICIERPLYKLDACHRVVLYHYNLQWVFDKIL